ncbi:hypothetical protein FGB62_17g440 [Gracilaria domingensis]|nr:hypothetical protein FGB62_17g440 [Gracilaria domingensis]
MLVAEAINKLNDKIDAEVTQIVSQAASNPAALAVPNPVTPAIPSNPVASTPANVRSSTPSASHLNQSALATEITNNEQSSGNAYRALLSQLGGSQALPLDPTLAAKQVQVPSPSTLTPNNRTDAARSLLAPSISADEATVNAINALNWRNDHSQSLQTPELLKNILEETFRSSLAPENSTVRRPAQRQTASPTDHLTRQIAEFSEAQDRRRPPSAIDAVAAAASGQAGWGVDISASAKHSFSEALDAQMSLQAAAGNAALGIPGVAGQKRAPMRQTANAGLSLFQAQTAAMDGRKARGAGGGRGNRTGSNMRNSGNALYREFSDVEMLKRISSAKAKQDQKAEARSNGSLGMNGSAAGGLTSGSQGSYSHLSGEVGSKRTKDESSVVIGHGGSGSGKKSRRSSNADGREKRQKVVNGGSA